MKTMKTYGEQERHNIDKLVSILNKARPSLTFETKHSPLDRAVPYDSLITIKNKEGFVIKSIILEAKVRNQSFPSYFLEVQKYKSLKKLQEAHSEYSIWYVNFAPDNTYIFDLLTTPLGKIQNIDMNDRTYISTNKKRTKKVYCLQNVYAQIIKYSYLSDPYKF